MDWMRDRVGGGSSRLSNIGPSGSPDFPGNCVGPHMGKERLWPLNCSSRRVLTFLNGPPAKNTKEINRPQKYQPSQALLKPNFNIKKVNISRKFTPPKTLLGNTTRYSRNSERAIHSRITRLLGERSFLRDVGNPIRTHAGTPELRDYPPREGGERRQYIGKLSGVSGRGR